MSLASLVESPRYGSHAALQGGESSPLRERRLQSSPLLAAAALEQVGPGNDRNKKARAAKEKGEDAERPKTFFGPWDDSFELGKALAKGAQGEVSVCVRRKTRRTYAVKRINLGQVQLQSKAAMMQTNLKREIQVMRELTHPKIVNLLEAFWEDNICFIVMDLAKGGSLHNKIYVGVGLGSEARSKHVAIQLLQGMGYMHSHSVIHRDLKPANVLITDSHPPPAPESPEGIGPSIFHEIKIADFGLSRTLKDPGGRSYEMTAVGTPAFVAPEVLSGNYNQMADFWSFGCIVYTMLCGEYPFDDHPDHVKHPGTEAKLRPSELWRRLTEPGKLFVLGLLKVKVKERLGLRACLAHPWLADVIGNGAAVGKDVVVTERQFSAQQQIAARGRSCWAGVLRMLCQHLQWCSAVLSGYYLWRPPVEAPKVGVVKKLCGWSGAAVDSLELWLRNGSLQTFGGLGGVRYTQETLDPDERIIAVTQEIVEDRYLGNALVFFTSKCRVITIRGEHSSDKARFVAPPGYQIIGLHFDQNQSCLVGIHLEPIRKAGFGAVEVISGWEGYAVDSVEFRLRDGNARSYGSEGGDEKKQWQLQRTEFLVIAEQGRRDAYLGYSLSFYTSAGNIFQLRGMEATRSPRFMAPVGRQVCGLKFEGSTFVHVKTCPDDGNMQDITTHDVIKI